MRTVKNKSKNLTGFTATKESVARLSIVSISLLIAMKVTASILTGSVGIRADAIHSVIDLLGAIVALVGIRISAKPADHQHAFGHGKAENIAAVFVSSLIFIAAGTIVYEAIHRFSTGGTMELLTIGISITAIALVINLLVSWYALRVARLTDSIALEATGRDLLADSYSSIAVLVGLVLIRTTGINVLDPIVALFVALLIGRTAFSTFRNAIGGLMDTRLSEEEENIIRTCITGYSNHVVGFHHLRTRKAGSERYVDFQLIVPRDFSVDEAHVICDGLEQRLANVLHPVSITIHIEPCNATCYRCTVLCTSRIP